MSTVCARYLRLHRHDTNPKITHYYNVCSIYLGVIANVAIFDEKVGFLGSSALEKKWGKR